jgi:hypothetical protein
VKEVLLQEFVNLIIIIEASFTPLKTLNPITAGILKLCRKALFYPASSDRRCEGTWRVQATDILP